MVESDKHGAKGMGQGLNEDERLLAFTDANSMFRSGALGALLRHFADPDVGGVCGRLQLVSPTHPCDDAGTLSDKHTHTPAYASPEGYYWNWENWLKQKESDVDSCLGANGAIYAIRRELFWSEIPDSTIVDDFVLGMKVRESGRRMIYEPGAVAEEDIPMVSDEWDRRVRIGAGDYQALWLCRRCLVPRYGWFAWMFASHKAFRWFTPQILVLLFAASWLLAWSDTGGVPGIPRTLPLAGLSLVVAAGAVGAVASKFRWRALRLFVLCDHFLTMQAALFVGFIRFCRGGLSGSWRRTPRGVD